MNAYTTFDVLSHSKAWFANGTHDTDGKIQHQIRCSVVWKPHNEEVHRLLGSAFCTHIDKQILTSSSFSLLLEEQWLKTERWVASFFFDCKENARGSDSCILAELLSYLISLVSLDSQVIFLSGISSALLCNLFYMTSIHLKENVLRFSTIALSEEIFSFFAQKLFELFTFYEL